MKPILFSTPMVKSLLAGNKTMTRRIIKPQPPEGFQFSGFLYAYENGVKTVPYQARFYKSTGSNTPLIEDINIKYSIGDILWVREKFRKNEMPTGFPYHYYTDDDYSDKDNEKWKPSIFMPKEAARIFLEVTDVKVERCSDISEEDAVNEGSGVCLDDLSNEDRYHNYNNPSTARSPLVHVSWFKRLWNKINGEETWNSFVFVYTFKIIDKP